MVEISVRLFGLRGKDSQLNKFQLSIPNHTSIGGLWSQLQDSAESNDRLSTTNREALLALVNGRPIHLLDGWDTSLHDDDQVTFMLKTAGG